MLAESPDTSEAQEDATTSHLRDCLECCLWLEEGERAHVRWRNRNEGIVRAILQETVQREGSRCLGLPTISALSLEEDGAQMPHEG